MNSISLYIIESTASLFLLLVIYQLFLKTKSNFKFNRFFLLLSIITSILIPIIDFSGINSPVVYHLRLSEITIYANSTKEMAAQNINIFSILKIIYLLITGLLLIKFLLQIRSIFLIKNNAYLVHSSMNNQKVFLIPQESFSFFHWIFIHESDQDNKAIFQHEKLHANAWHSLDIILLKILQIAFWFNPFLFLIEKELRLQHEFAVDAMMLENGTKKTEYQQLLLNQLFNTEFNLLANNFNQTYLKNRFIMMTKNKNKKVSKLFLFAFMSLVVITPMTISCSMDSDEAVIEESNKAHQETPVETPAETPKSTTNQDNSQIFMVVEEMPSFPGGEKAMYKYIGEKIKYPEQAKNEGIEGRVFISFVVEKDGSITEVELLRGIGGGCDEVAIEVIQSMPKWLAGKQKGKEVRVKYRMPIKFSLQ